MTDQDHEVVQLRQRLRALEAQAAGVTHAQILTRSFAGEIQYWSRGMERLYGFTANEALGRISHQLLRTEFPSSVQELESELLEREEWTGELRHRRRDGEEIVVVSHQSLHRRGGTDALVTEVNNDITGEWRGRGTRLYLADLVDSSNDAIVGKSLDGVITSWNKAAEQMFGYSAEEAINQPVSLLIPAERHQEEVMILERLKTGEQLRHYETIRRRKDGREIHVSLTISPIRGSSGEIVGASKIVRDITVETVSASRIAELQAELVHVARLSTMGQMASAIAHELNQPLTAVSSYAGALNRLLAGPASDMARARDIVERIRQQTIRAGAVLRRLRDHVAKRSTMRIAEDFNATVRDAVEMGLVGSRHQNVQTVMEFDDTLGMVEIDRIQIGQVIINLVRNAVEAMEASPHRQLTIATRAIDGHVEIVVADTGSGIAPEVAERLFQPFVTSKASGMGLGLSICREIVEAHGGQIQARPAVAGGTEFAVRLPA